MTAAQNQARVEGWYSIENRSDVVSEVFIYGVIGASFFEDSVDAKAFVAELKSLNTPKIRIRINSPGGSVGDAVAIYNAIRDHDSETEAIIDGHALSAGAWIGLGADRVVAAPHSRLMIHNPWDLVQGDATELRKYADVLDGLAADIADVLVEKAGWNRKHWLDRMDRETWYSAEEMLSNHLVDEISGADAKAKNTFDLSILGLFRNAPVLTPGAPAPELEPAAADLLLPGYLAYQKNLALLAGNIGGR